MITKIIIPKNIERKESNSGREFLSIKAGDGKFYQVWIEKLFHNFFEDTPIKIKIKPVGEWNNVIGTVGKVKTKELKKIEKNRKTEYKERAKGAAKGACFNKACDIAIALYQKGGIKKKVIVPEIKKIFKELLKIISY